MISWWPGELDAAAARRGRPRDDVHAGTVVADEVHVDRGEVADRLARRSAPG